MPQIVHTFHCETGTEEMVTAYHTKTPELDNFQLVFTDEGKALGSVQLSKQDAADLHAMLGHYIKE